jgi:hypothetical protein
MACDSSRHLSSCNQHRPLRETFRAGADFACAYDGETYEKHATLEVSMRLIKLLAYAALGFVIYELYQGMSEGSSRGGGFGGDENAGEASGSGRGLRDALNRDQGRMRMTGPGRGELLTTEDDTGARSTHAVGRGVIKS